MIASGTVVSHYRILGQLGSGGMGVVYRAVDLRLDRTVAIKFLPQHLGEDENSRDRFIAEAKAASALDYPTIGTIYEVDETPEFGMFIVMAYYAGESLAARLRRGRMATAEAVDVAIQVGEGLTRAHERNIVHRDVKPANIIVTPGGLVKIVDFGIAKVADISMTEAGLMLGTPAFMSPEQSVGETVDHRCDIWSLGVVLYFMLAGRLPFTGESTADVWRAIRQSEPPPIDVPPAIQAVLARALTKSPADRYDSMRRFVADLRSAHRTGLISPGDEPGIRRPLTGDEPTTASHAPSTVLTTKTTGELRQITIASCSLASFESLAEHLDPEQLSLVITGFRRVVEDVTRPREGRVAHALGGEAILHFGLPHAHEDDAVRAVTTALAIAREMEGLHSELSREIPTLASQPLSVRIGIHTGPVVVDDAEHALKQSVVVGMTGTLANKTRDSAETGQVIVTEHTSRLVASAFDLRSLGPTSLPGLTRVTILYAVEGVAPVGGRQDDTNIGGTPLVGRDRELGLLVDRWQEVKDGNGQVALISAGAGVGKSRLVAALKSHVAGDRHSLLVSRCSPYHRSSPLWPIVDLLARTFGLDRSGSPASHFAKIRALLTAHRLATAENLYLMASLLSVPYPTDEPSPAIPPQREKERTLGLLLQLLFALSSTQPVLFIVEDLHWADPTTLELLSLIVDQGPTAPLLTVVTFRPEFSSPWGNRAHLTQLTLSRLSRRDAERLVVTMLGKRVLPDEFLAQIIGNADGVPLFLEELTKALMQSDAFKDGVPGPEARKILSSLAVPSTLKDSLMARLDRLGSAKEVAQMAAVFGRTFHYEWLQAVSPLDDETLRQNLTRLVDAELLFQRGLPPEATYTFKHALIKDAAYQALLKPRRQYHHARIAEALAERFPEITETQPELMAHHYAEAGLIEQAVAHWQRAGRHAAKRSGYVEAAADFQHALECLRTLPPGTGRPQQEMDLLVAQGSAMMATMGWAAPAVGAVYTQALQLSDQAKASRPLFDVVQGLTSYYLVRSQHDVARAQSERLTELAREIDDPNLEMEAALRMGISAYVTGSLAESHRYLAKVGTEAVPGGPRPPMYYGQDRGVVAKCHWSWVWWLTGFADRALAESQAALTVALDLNHPFSMAWARLYVAIIHSVRGEPAAALEQADALAALCTEQAFSYRLAQAEILRGWSQAVIGSNPAALDQIRAGIAAIRATGAAAYQPFYAMLFADACLRAGQWIEGQSVVEESLALIKTTGETFLEAELHRLHGALIIGADPARSAEATACYERALAIAVGQGARALELRAAASLVSANPEDPAARNRLGAILSLFTEGLDGPDVNASRLLLGRASSRPKSS